jgi:hypothetical protein
MLASSSVGWVALVAWAAAIDPADVPMISSASVTSNPASRGSAIQGWSIRPLSSGDFAAITLASLHATFDAVNAIRLQLDEENCDQETTALLRAPFDVNSEKSVKSEPRNPRRRLPGRRLLSLPRHVRRDRPEDCQRRRAIRDTGGAYLVR